MTCVDQKVKGKCEMRKGHMQDVFLEWSLAVVVGVAFVLDGVFL